MSEAPRIVNGLKLPPKRVIKLPPKKVVQIVKHVDNGPKEWFFHPETGDDIGPLSAYGLKGRISRETLVWKEGMSDWSKAGDVPELASVLASVKPVLPPSVISEKWMWCLAAVPIPVSWLLKGFMGGAAGAQTVCIVATILLNIIFMSLDIKELKKRGRDISGALWLGFILIPVYMFVRAAKYSKKYAAAIVWCVLFALEILAGAAAEGGNLQTGLFSSRLSSSELSAKVMDAINAEYQSIEGTRGVLHIKDLYLINDLGNQYHGVATLQIKSKEAANVSGNVSDDKSVVEVKVNVNVTYDGETFLWKVQNPLNYL